MVVWVWVDRTSDKSRTGMWQKNDGTGGRVGFYRNALITKSVIKVWRKKRNRGRVNLLIAAVKRLVT